jgi:uncharacterized protein YneR
LTPLILGIPRLNDDLEDFRLMALVWQEVMEAGDGAAVHFDFTHCDFLRPAAVVFLGGLARLVGARGGQPRFLVNTMSDAVRANLEQNGFAHAMGAPVPPWSGNSIPYREFEYEDKNAVVLGYLKPLWLGKGWVKVSAALANEISGQMWEMFTNAFEHGQSPIGVMTCGQHFPKNKELVLAVADFGVGIPSNVRLFLHDLGLSGAEAMRWAFRAGHSTSSQSGFARGMGLDFLKAFVQKNDGIMQIISHDGYARIDAKSESFDNLQPFFEGTLVQVQLRRDNKFYTLSDETNPEPFF